MRILSLMPGSAYQILLCDIGGVLGTNGWDGSVRDAICRRFSLDVAEIADRHRLMFDSYERGYMTFEEYLEQVFFGAPRNFAVEEVRDAAYQQSIPWQENIAFFQSVKKQNRLKVGLISNEGEGITQYRVDAFQLRGLADFFVVSHFVHMRKPDRGIWQLALDLAQVSAAQAIYIDDRAMFVEIARGIGITAFQHVSLPQTRQHLLDLGLQVE